MLTIARPTVLLPHPDSPTNPSVSPWLSSKLTPSTAFTSAILRAKTPPTTGKRTRRSWISRSFSISNFGIPYGSLETRWHLTQCPGAVSIRSGSITSHRSNRSVHRVTNLQPAGRSRMLGTLPGIVRSRSFFSPSTVGKDASRPRV